MERVSKQRIEDFLRESNAIEGVFDDDALQAALVAWEYLFVQPALTEAVVLETHRLLMQPRSAWDDATASLIGKDYAGKIRDCDVWVGGRKGMKPSSLKFMLGMWARRSSQHDLPPISKELHIMYEKIHPFIDGNGRTGRMFLNWTRLHRTNEPFLIIKNSEKQEYYKWFRV